MASVGSDLFFVPLNQVSLSAHLPELLSIISQDKWARWSRKALCSAIEAGSDVILLKNPVATIGIIIIDVRSVEAELHYLAVDKVYRRQGLAKKLLKYAVDYARENNAVAMFLEVRATNLAAINLYKSYGFASAGLRPSYYSFAGEKQDAVVMRYDFVS